MEYDAENLNFRARLAMKWMTSHRLNQARTAISALIGGTDSTKLICILGCQRSGTTMTADLMGLSPRVRVYGEGDERYFFWDGAPRLKSIEEVKTQIDNERSQFTVLKPLCESQRAGSLLNEIENSCGVWVFRDYRACVASHLKYYSQFHDGREYIRELLHVDKPCWKKECLPTKVEDILRQKANQSLNIETGYALYWLARNSHIVAGIDSRIKLLCYEELLENPTECVADLYQFVGIPFSHRYARIINSQHAKKKHELAIDRDIAEECEKLYAELRAVMSSTSLAPAEAP